MSDPTVERSSRKLAASAQQMAASTHRVEDSADRRTELAADRTVFAAERTYAAWVRTGLVALASGVGAKALLAQIVPEWIIVADGSVLVLFSAFCFITAVWRQINPGLPPPAPDTRQVSRVILIGFNSFLALVSLSVLIGIWLGRSGSLMPAG